MSELDTPAASGGSGRIVSGSGRTVFGLVLVGADAAAGWLLYDAVAPVLGTALWVVAALVVCGLLVDGFGGSPGADGVNRLPRPPVRR